MFKSSIKSYCFFITRLYVTAILFACRYVTRWGKFGRVFCKQTSVAACRFQNECNKVEIALRVVQFWSEVKLVITNRTPASRSCDFVITRLISDLITCMANLLKCDWLMRRVFFLNSGQKLLDPDWLSRFILSIRTKYQKYTQ